MTCVDVSRAAIEAARKRLSDIAHVAFHQGDMHALPFADASFDHIFAMHALNFSHAPCSMLRETFRLLRSGGRLAIAVLRAHQHEETMRAFDHGNLGFEVDALSGLLLTAGFAVQECRVNTRENRPPYFEVISASIWISLSN